MAIRAGFLQVVSLKTFFANRAHRTVFLNRAHRCTKNSEKNEQKNKNTVYYQGLPLEARNPPFNKSGEGNSWFQP